MITWYYIQYNCIILYIMWLHYMILYIILININHNILCTIHHFGHHFNSHCHHLLKLNCYRIDRKSTSEKSDLKEICILPVFMLNPPSIPLKSWKRYNFILTHQQVWGIQKYIFCSCCQENIQPLSKCFLCTSEVMRNDYYCSIMFIRQIQS